ncbi:MAG: DUF3307 domain-containing protein [Leadbetterella sp.]|nr:DUF3307 domain-containing protein [Leadbetterella sp.]
MIELSVQLVLAHLLGDFVLQPARWIRDRNKHRFRSPALYYHVGVHILSMLVVMGLNCRYLAAMGIISVSHLIIDGFKASLHGKYNDRLLFLTDQALHLLVIGGVVLSYFPAEADFSLLRSPETLLTLTALVFISFASGIILKVLLSKWSGEISSDKKYQGMSEAGKYIGILERLFIFFFVVTGRWEGVGFLLTAKSIFRFGDLTTNKDHKLTEYILIGTLLSFGIAILTGLGYNHLCDVLTGK